jgi:AbrB family looped-hinge helix DNA binding protein
METTKLSSKGQIVIPKGIREEHNWQAGLEFVVIDTAEGVLLRPKRSFKPTTIDEAAGCLRFEGEPKQIAEMDEAVTASLKGTWRDRG